MRISVEPDALRALSSQLKQSGEQINQIRAVLNQAMGSLVNEMATVEIIMNQWRSANLQGEQITSMLMEMANTLQIKGDQFQTVDDQPVSIYRNPTLSSFSPVAMFGANKEKDSQLLFGFGQESSIISNPSSAVAAVVGQSMGQDTEFGWDWDGPSAAGWSSLGYGSLMIGTMLKSGFNVNLRNQGEVATIKGARSPFATKEGIRGTRYTLNHAAQNPQVWKFVDPKIAAKEAFSFKGVGGKIGYAGLLFDTGVEGYNDYQQGGATRATASVIVNGGIGIGTMAGSAAIGAAIGSVVPVAGTAVGAAVGLGVGVAVSAVTEIEINGKSLKTHAVDGVDIAIDEVVNGVGTAADGISDAANEAAEAVSGSVDTVSRGASRMIDGVKERLGGLSKMFS